MAAALQSMFTAITTLPAPAQVSSPGEPSRLSMRGSGSCVKQSGRRARSFRSNGSLGRLPLVSTRTIAGAWTSSPMVPPGSARHYICCDVTVVSALALTGEGRPQPFATLGTALPWPSQNAASALPCAAHPELLRRGPQRPCVLA